MAPQSSRGADALSEFQSLLGRQIFYLFGESRLNDGLVLFEFPDTQKVECSVGQADFVFDMFFDLLTDLSMSLSRWKHKRKGFGWDRGREGGFLSVYWRALLGAAGGSHLQSGGRLFAPTRDPCFGDWRFLVHICCFGHPEPDS